MEQTNLEIKNTEPIHWGHFGVVLGALLLLAGATWMQRPELFAWHKPASNFNLAQVPKYYAYVEPAGNSGPMVAGASTNPGPSIINEDGSISQANMGEVLGASTQGVQLSLDSVKVISVPDSDAAVKKYFADARQVESSPVDSNEFEAALSSGDQAVIDRQAQKLILVRDAVEKLAVPVGLVKLQKLKIIQYNSAINLLQNFTQADNSPELVGDYLQQFLKSQEDLDKENKVAAQNYPRDVPKEVSVFLDNTPQGAAETKNAKP